MPEVEIDDRLDLEMQLLSSAPADHNSGSSTREIIQMIILVVRSSQIFTAGRNHSESPPVSRLSSSKTVNGETTTIERMEEISGGEVVDDEVQTAPLLEPARDNTRWMKTLMHALYATQIFKARAASVHLGRLDATEIKPEVAEAGDSLAASSDHCITIDQKMTNSHLQDSQTQNISKIVREKNFTAFQEFGGFHGVANALNTDLVSGLSDKEATYRRAKQALSLDPTSTRRFSYFVSEALNSTTIRLLSLAAPLSLGFGIKEEGLESGWFDGAIVLVTIIVLVLFTSIHNYWQERRAWNKSQKQRFSKGGLGEVHVIRGGEDKCICISMLVWGDVVLLKKGYQVPADGLFVSGEALELDYGCDEPYKIDEKNPFLSYGERVINGDARMVMTSVDMKMRWSDMMSEANNDPDTKFKLEAHLDKLNTFIHNTGLIISILILIVLFSRYMVGKMDQENGYRLESKEEPPTMRNIANAFKKIIQESKYTARALTKLLGVSLVGVMGGVPFVVSLAMLYNNHKMLSGKATEQDLQVVSKMAFVTRICTDTFGDFTEDEMEVDKLFIGGKVMSACSTISPNVMEVLCDAIGATMEKPFLHWAKDKLGFKREKVIQILDRMGMKPFEEPCGVLMRRTGECDEVFVHMNGPVKEILKMCTHYYNSTGCIALMDDQVTRFLDQANEDMLHKHLTTIAFACKCTNTQTLDTNDLALIAIIGLKHKSWVDTKIATEACRACGIETVIVSRKKVPVLRNIALQSGLINDDDSEPIVLKGKDFRNFTDEERLEKVDKIRIMGEALPSDKSLLVKFLRKKCQVVVFLGQRTDEAPALRGADIGIAMGTWSSKQAIESSEIIIWDGSFVDLMHIVNSGKCMYNNIQNFIQLVLIMTISSNLINFLGTVAFGDAPLTTVQLVWVNICVTFLGGLALFTKPLTDELVSCRRSLITVDMIRNILAQVLYQVICLMIIQGKGSGTIGTSQYTKTIISNSFILCQFFNQFNSRELRNKNFFRGIHRHKEFLVSVAIFIVLEAVLVMVQEILGYSTRLDWKLSVGCVLVGAMSWLLDFLGKCISRFIKMLVVTLHGSCWASFCKYSIF